MFGLVTSNARHAGTNMTLPNLNFSICAAALEPMWAALTGPARPIAAELRALDTTSKHLADLWSLAGAPSDLAQGRGERRTKGAERLRELLSDRGVDIQSKL